MLEVYGKNRKIVIDFGDENLQDITLDSDIQENVTIHQDKEDTSKWVLEFDSSVIKTDTLMKCLFERYKVKDIKIQDMDIENIVRDIYNGRITLS